MRKKIATDREAVSKQPACESKPEGQDGQIHHSCTFHMSSQKGMSLWHTSCLSEACHVYSSDRKLCKSAVVRKSED